jgi:hypothetical protein
MTYYKKFTWIVLIGIFLVASCKKQDHELGRMLNASEIKFDVIQDLAVDPGGNTVILINNTPETVPMWDYGTGKSTRQKDTVRFAFKGDYVIKYSAMTAGGVVEMPPVTIKVTADNLNYVNDPLWTLLSGGVGNEKTWYFDANPNGDKKFFTSPIYFAGMDNAYGTLAADGQSVQWTEVCTDPTGPNCWIYRPNYTSDTWAAEKRDYGFMTFSLKGGPFLKTDHKGVAGVGTQSGTYFLDVNTLMLTTTDATPLHVAFTPNDAVGMSNWRILSLTENTMQLAVKHKTKAEYQVLNYISKNYSDNWVPSGPQPDPNFDHGDQGGIVAVTPTKTWKLDLEVPYNWLSLEGAPLNNWNTRADIIATGWAPYGDADVQNIDNASISFSQNGTVVVTQDNGTSESGTYTIDEPTNTITFSGITPLIPIASWVSATTTDENKWKIVKVERSAVNDAVTGIWFGKRDPLKAEYMAFHFVLR